MKKLLYPLLLLLFLASCSDEVQFNTPSIQGTTDAGFFHAFDAVAHKNEDGSVSLVGKEGSRQLTIKLPSVVEGAHYELGVDTATIAKFTTVDGVIYSTDTTGNGEVFLKSIENGVLSGEFHFNARVNGVEGDTLNFSQGAFLSVPYGNAESEGDSIDVPGETLPPVTTDCDEAATQVAAAAQAYEGAQNSGDQAAITEACQAYATALQQQIEVCGDDSGALQQILEGLPCNQ